MKNGFNLPELGSILLRLDRYYRAEDMKCESQEEKKERKETLGKILEI